MALGRTRRPARTIDYWPGFVDALSTMLLVITFLLSVFMLSQFFMSRDVSQKDNALSQLNRQIEQLTSLLSLERAGKADTQSSLASLQATLDSADQEKASLAAQLQGSAAAAGAAGAAADESARKLDAQSDVLSGAMARVDALNQQIAALRRQLAAIEAALSASESRDQEAQAKISDLGSRLNVALAQKVQELNRYRSDFFGRLREIIGNRPGIRVVGDRFVFESSVLFDSGQATVKPSAAPALDKLAAAAVDLEREIPPNIPWVLRVDGHTDRRPIASPLFKSNWDLSAERAIAVVQYLVSKGVDPQRLVAAGFGEFQPIDPGTSEEAMSRNRRIELKLTER
ncbi:peptidoglycan -binding protein [Lichenibacterium dinghuense]|uniref:peptidoglycan -binding protein n=1 Tax=Lichenibacterium dinghuense TaxID=2895977 RepID=UPI001F1E31E6|nr:peptidoglycan -binding protein [Lichenibacterium sp. 6Y81]